jgi:hypothetical protein
MEQKYIEWRRVPRKGFVASHWVGMTSNGQSLFTIDQRRTGRTKVRVTTYLTRKNGSAEVCPSLSAAKDYGNNLARLANFPAFE